MLLGTSLGLSLSEPSVKRTLYGQHWTQEAVLVSMLVPKLQVSRTKES